jgi:hypothetical protein
MVFWVVEQTPLVAHLIGSRSCMFRRVSGARSIPIKSDPQFQEENTAEARSLGEWYNGM